MALLPHLRAQRFELAALVLERPLPGLELDGLGLECGGPFIERFASLVGGLAVLLELQLAGFELLLVLIALLPLLVEFVAKLLELASLLVELPAVLLELLPGLVDLALLLFAASALLLDLFDLRVEGPALGFKVGAQGLKLGSVGLELPALLLKVLVLLLELLQPLIELLLVLLELAPLLLECLLLALHLLLPLLELFVLLVERGFAELEAVGLGVELLAAAVERLALVIELLLLVLEGLALLPALLVRLFKLLALALEGLLVAVDAFFALGEGVHEGIEAALGLIEVIAALAHRGDQVAQPSAALAETPFRGLELIAAGLEGRGHLVELLVAGIVFLLPLPDLAELLFDVSKQAEHLLRLGGVGRGLAGGVVGIVTGGERGRIAQSHVQLHLERLRAPSPALRGRPQAVSGDYGVE